jgi:hypothetical protein
MFEKLFDKLFGKVPSGSILDLETEEIITKEMEKKAEKLAESTLPPQDPFVFAPRAAKPKKFKKTIAVKYFRIANNHGAVPIFELTKDAVGEYGGTHYTYFSSNRFGALMLFRPLDGLLTLDNGELKPLDVTEVGKINYAFIDVKEQLVAVCGGADIAGNILRECIARNGDVYLSSLYDRTKVDDLLKVTKIEISVNQSERLFNDKAYRDLFESLAFWDSQKGTVSLIGNFDSNKTNDMIAYFVNFDMQAESKAFKNIIVTGKDYNDKTRVINIFNPRAIGRITYQTTEEYLFERDKLLKLAVLVFASRDDNVSAEPAKYVKSIDDYLKENEA